MSILFKDKDQIVNDIVEKLRPSFPDNTDFTPGTFLRDTIEAFAEELDYQYFQLESAYESAFIDSVSGDDLENLVALLGVTRNPATKSIGKVTFYRTTPAESDYFIPQGTYVKTLPNANGISIIFETISDGNLLQGQTSVDVNVRSIETGTNSNIPALTVKIINNPPIGIEFVKNTEPMSGGEEIESDYDLKDRSKHVLDSNGLGTVNALLYKIKSTPGVKEISVIDMARGIGTVDVFVLTDIFPMTSSKKAELESVIFETKAGGIDVKLTEPSVIFTNISVIVTLDSGYVLSNIKDGVEDAIKNYVNTLDIGKALIVNQLSKSILNSNTGIIDVSIVNPSTNINVTSTQIIRTGTITIG